MLTISTRRRQAAFIFILITVALDMLALGVMIPVLPKLITEFEGGDISGAAGVVGIFGFSWALMQFLFQPVLGALSDRFGRRPIVLASNFGLGLDYIFMALAPIAAVSVYRPADLRRHRRELLDRQRLCRRHHARGKARRALRHAWRGLRLWLHSGTGDRRRARQLRVAPAVLRRGGVEPRQCALRLLHPAGVALRGKARAKDRLARRQYFRRAETAGRPARTGHARGRGVPVLSGA